MSDAQRAAPPAVQNMESVFADNLFDLRRARKISRRQLEEATGISARVIEKIETGAGGWQSLRRPASIGEAVILAFALGVQPAQLLAPRMAPDA